LPTVKEFPVADLRTVMTGLIFGESPRWHDDRLWCIDMGAREVLAVDSEGKREVIIHVHTACRPSTSCQMAVC
jgi:sugar lactone lactonase YvrE